MDVAGPGAASLGASLNHSSLNLANASGAFFGGLVIDAGYGWTSPALVGAAMAATGLAAVRGQRAGAAPVAPSRARRRRELAGGQPVRVPA